MVKLVSISGRIKITPLKKVDKEELRRVVARHAGDAAGLQEALLRLCGLDQLRQMRKCGLIYEFEDFKVEEEDN